MFKYLVVFLGFMGFVFYEMSGGSEFVSVAEEKRAALKLQEERAEAERLAAAAQAEAEAEAAAKAKAIARAATISATPVVLASAAVTPEEPAAAVAQARAAVEAEKAEVVTAQSEPEPATPKDLREVTAARVNMRGGPGRSFSIVSKLTGGDQVEILQDPGDGWVKLRVVDTGRVGWMADFLLTAANN